MGSTPPSPQRWQRVLWLCAGLLSLLVGVVGILVPLLPTVPMLLLAALCFSHASARWEARMLADPRVGPLLRDWRAAHALSLRAKQYATVMMTLGSLAAWWLVEAPWGWAPALVCGAMVVWLWRLPTASVRSSRHDD